MRESGWAFIFPSVLGVRSTAIWLNVVVVKTTVLNLHVVRALFFPLNNTSSPSKKWACHWHQLTKTLAHKRGILYTNNPCYSSTKNFNSVINYSPSCCSKPSWCWNAKVDFSWIPMQLHTIRVHGGHKSRQGLINDLTYGNGFGVNKIALSPNEMKIISLNLASWQTRSVFPLWKWTARFGLR